MNRIEFVSTVATLANVAIESMFRAGQQSGWTASIVWVPDTRTIKIVESNSGSYWRGHYTIWTVSGSRVGWEQFATDSHGRVNRDADIPTLWDVYGADVVRWETDDVYDAALLFSKEHMFCIEREAVIVENPKDTRPWGDRKMDELSRKPKGLWSEADWDAYNYISNANAEKEATE